MKGHIQRRGKSWRLKFDIGNDPQTGERRVRYRTVRGGKRDAQRELNRVLAEVEDNKYFDTGRLTVGQYLDRWLADYASVNVSPKTYERYEEVVEKHLKPALGNPQIGKLRPLDIQTYYSEALRSGRLNGKGGLSARTVHHHHRILFQALRQAVRWEVITRNPAEAAKPPSPETREINYLQPDELIALLRFTKSTRLHVPVLLAATTGLRRGEVLGLRWKDIDLDKGWLTVTQALEQTRSGLRFKAPKTKRSRRTVTLPQITGAALRDHRIAQMKERLALGLGKPPGEEVVFTRYDGEPVNPRNFSKEFDRIVKRSGVRRITFHGLRHTHLTNLLRANVHPKIASERAGHSSVSITLDIYSHVIPGLQDEVAQTVDTMLAGVLDDGA